MSLRTLAALAFVFAIAPSALADVPAADASADDPSCTVAAQTRSGTTCAECNVGSSSPPCDQQVDLDYTYACSRNSTVQVWCNGPSRTTTPDPGTCALGAPGAPWGGAAALAALAALALGVRRRAVRL
jgi:hypothetical protein